MKKESLNKKVVIKNIDEGEITINQKCLVYIFIGVIIGALAMSLCWPKRVAKLKNGEEVVVTVGDYTVSADEAYNAVKNENTLLHILDLVDYSILVDMYGKTDEADTYAKEQSETIYKNYEEYYGYSKEEFLEANGYKDEKTFLTYMNHDYYYSKYYNDYLKKKITDEEVEKYYNSYVGGKKRVHIYTKYDDNTDLEKIKKELDKGKSISKVNEKYTDVTYNDLGEITFTDYLEYSNDFLTNLYPLKKGETSNVFQDGNAGDTLIYVESAEEKSELKDIKDELKEMLAKKMGNDDETLYYKAFIELREEKGLKFSDTEYQDMYNNYVKKYK